MEIVNASIEARTGSKRFPNKILKKINGVPLIIIQAKRVMKSREVDNVIIATTKNPKDKKIIDLCKKYKIKYFIGSEKNVFKRVFNLHKKYKSDVVVRLCGDNPLQDHKLIDDAILVYKKNKNKIISNGGKDMKIPDGFNVEVFNFKFLKKLNKKNLSNKDCEHVTLYFYKSNNFKKKYINYKNKKLWLKGISLDLDYPIQFKFLKKLSNFINIQKDSLEAIVFKIKKNKILLKEITSINKKIKALKNL